jgi:hypothetical protein
VEFAPNDSPVGAFLVEDDHPETVAALVRSLAERARFDVMCLNGFDPDSPHLHALGHALTDFGFRVEVEDHASAVADLKEGYPAYRNRLNGHFRRNLNRRARKIEAASTESCSWTASTARRKVSNA